MKYKQLGGSGIKVAEICLGTMTFGREADESTARTIIGQYLEAGGNFIDTADVYGAQRGDTETVVGKLLKGRRKDIILATKTGFGAGMNNEGMSRRHLINAVDGSLSRLQTDWIDVFYLHIYDRSTPFEETLSTLDALVKSGKIRYIGVSNFKAYQIMKMLWVSDARSLVRFVVYQPQYNLLEREIEREFVPICQTEGLGMVTWAPLAGGFLSGKYKPSTTEGRLRRVGRPDTDSWENRVNDFSLGISKAVDAIAQKRKVPCSQVALNWLRSKPWVTAPIIGARTAEQYAENAGCLGWELDAGEGETLDKVSTTPKPYPYHFVDWLQRG
ncbi:MAG TPA: aldo/keto reductase [Spirochaetia bacterium]|nr:aldo/keto reductase [Spirochaetia bacterium]